MLVCKIVIIVVLYFNKIKIAFLELAERGFQASPRNFKILFP